MTPNLNRVPPKTWRAWSDSAKAVFNRVYDFLYENPQLALHPQQPLPKPAFWKTTAWNCAWIAADAVDDVMPTEVHDILRETGQTLRTTYVQTGQKLDLRA